jgi:hypothetical protein
MSDFPKINYIKSFSLIPIKKANVQISAAGYPMSSALAIVTKNKIRIQYEKVSTTDKASVDTFFDTNQGSSFSLYIPLNSTAYEVIFNQDEIEWSYNNDDFDEASCSIEFLEV